MKNEMPQLISNENTSDDITIPTPEEFGIELKPEIDKYFARFKQ